MLLLYSMSFEISQAYVSYVAIYFLGQRLSIYNQCLKQKV
jgi:hypothetical protein